MELIEGELKHSALDPNNRKEMEHQANAPQAELFDDAVVRDGLADHLRECYGVRSGKSMYGLTAASPIPPWLPSE
jgi:hypothetical protein